MIRNQIELASAIFALESDRNAESDAVTPDMKVYHSLDNAIFALWDVYYHLNPTADVINDMVCPHCCRGFEGCDTVPHHVIHWADGDRDCPGVGRVLTPTDES